MRMREGWRVAALCGAMWIACAARPGFASSVTATTGGGLVSNTPGQLISDAPNAHTLEEAVAGYGLIRAAVVSSSPGGNGVASSQFDVDFTLSSAATLAIGYHYDVNLVLDYPGAASYKFGLSTTSTANNITDPGGTAWTYLARGTTTGGTGDDHADFCPEFTGLQTAGTCSFHHGDTGVLLVPFTAGHNHLEVAMFVSATLGGTADGFNTGQITGITLPNGVTFTYDDLGGNPLNVHAAASAAPEPASFALIGAGLALAGVLRRCRKV